MPAKNSLLTEISFPVNLCRELLEIPLDLDVQSSADEDSLDRVTVEVFDARLLIPSTLHDAGYTYGSVAVALIDLHFQRRLGVPSVDADNGQPQPI